MKRVSAPWRWVGLILFLLAVYAAARLTGAERWLEPSHLVGTLRAMGAWGWVVFVLAVVLAELASLPGIVFVGVASAVWGSWLGCVHMLLAAVFSSVVSFALARWVGGKPLSAVRWRWVERTLSRIQRHPVLTVIALRSVFWMATWLSYVLAMSPIRFRHYLLGTALGLLTPIAAASFLIPYLWGGP